MRKLTLIALLTLLTLLTPALASAQDAEDAPDEPLYVGGPHGDELPELKKKLRFYRGESREQLTPEEFFTDLGRSDLVVELRQNRRKRRAEAISFSVIGAALGGGAVWLGVQGESCDGLGPVEEHDCESRNRQLVGGAITVGALGLRLLVVGLDAAFTSPLPVSPKAARSLAQDHNDALTAPESINSQSRLPRFDIGAGISGRSAGIVLTGRF